MWFMQIDKQINKILDELRNPTINWAETDAGYVYITAGIQYVCI